jgi:hypothetical protein
MTAELAKADHCRDDVMDQIQRKRFRAHRGGDPAGTPKPMSVQYGSCSLPPLGFRPGGYPTSCGRFFRRFSGSMPSAFASSGGGVCSLRLPATKEYTHAASKHQYRGSGSGRVDCKGNRTRRRKRGPRAGQMRSIPSPEGDFSTLPGWSPAIQRTRTSCHRVIALSQRPAGVLWSISIHSRNLLFV